ncbi:MAG: hypothetical protein JRI25_29590, partial [Deltaproteobacteria bacterium]|nr:hypothetical protein [Deltaproteobacteria bacterium]
YGFRALLHLAWPVVVALAVLLVWRFQSGAWKHIDLTGIESDYAQGRTER